MFWEKINITCHPGATMAECIVLCMGYWSYVWNICFMYGILVLCLGYLSYVLDTSLMCRKTKITCRPGATMAECIVLCLGHLSYVWDPRLKHGTDGQDVCFLKNFSTQAKYPSKPSG